MQVFKRQIIRKQIMYFYFKIFVVITYMKFVSNGLVCLKISFVDFTPILVYIYSTNMCSEL